MTDKIIDLSDMRSASGKRKLESVNLDEFLSPKSKTRKRRMGEVLNLDDMLTEFKPTNRAVEVVLFWTDWTCHCGRHYEAPTYGDTFTKYDRFRGDKVVASIYKPYLPANHCKLPRRVESHHIIIPHCPQCVHEDQVQIDRQGDLFSANN